MKFKVIITGATGMVGQGVLIECLESSNIESILVINRRPLGIDNPKLNEIVHKDFHDLSSIKEELGGYDACFFCMGVSAMGMNEEDYSRITYGITEHFANTLFELNPDLVFNYVSGTGTVSSEKGNVMWARVKGRTENMVLNKGFKDAYAFRPGIILPEKGVKSSTGWYNILYKLFRPLYPLLRRLESSTTSTNVGLAMINTLLYPTDVKHLGNKEINVLAAIDVTV